jgi:hypothetical protein
VLEEGVVQQRLAVMAAMEELVVVGAVVEFALLAYPMAAEAAMALFLFGVGK